MASTSIDPFSLPTSFFPYDPYDHLGNRITTLFDLHQQRLHRMRVTEVLNGLTLEFEVPGISKANLSLRVAKKEAGLQLELTAGTKLKKTYVLGSRVDPSKITATCKDGLLTVSCPYFEQEKPREIEISIG